MKRAHSGSEGLCCVTSKEQSWRRVAIYEPSSLRFFSKRVGLGSDPPSHSIAAGGMRSADSADPLCETLPCKSEDTPEAVASTVVVHGFLSVRVKVRTSRLRINRRCLVDTFYLSRSTYGSIQSCSTLSCCVNHMVTDVQQPGDYE